MKRYSYAWITVGFFLVSIVGHWTFGWFAFAGDAAAHGETPAIANFLTEMGRDTFENWQSEFLQLLWQVVGLAYFLYVGSPTSREGSDRLEAKIDVVIKRVAGDEADELLRLIDARYLRHARTGRSDAG